jgi:mRNA interferase MazF
MAGITSPQRGEVYWVNLDPIIGTEIGKTRPAVIISNNVGNQFSARVIVAPITKGGLEKTYPFEVLLAVGEAGLAVACKAALDQIRSVDKQRLVRRIGVLSPERMQDIDRAIRVSVAV